MFIDKTYFIRDINIGQRSQPEVKENLGYFIEKYEEDFLVKVFGYDMAEDLILANDDLPNAPQELKDIIEGKGVWKGLVNDIKISPIANYVYVKYVESELVQAVGTGIVKPMNENSITVNPLYKITRAWNEMIFMIVKMHRVTQINTSLYPDYAWINYSDLCFDNLCGCYDPCKGDYIFKLRNTLGL